MNLSALAADLIVTLSVSGTVIENHPSASAVTTVFKCSEVTATSAYGIGCSGVPDTDGVESRLAVGVSMASEEPDSLSVTPVDSSVELPVLVSRSTKP